MKTRSFDSHHIPRRCVSDEDEDCSSDLISLGARKALEKNAFDSDEVVMAIDGFINQVSLKGWIINLSARCT